MKLAELKNANDEYLLDKYEVTSKNSEPDGWGKLEINIKETETGKIVQYQRNYRSLYNTFYPFMCNGKKLALVSDSYVRTAILDLETGEILGGEEKQSSGFCPTDFYVPYQVLSASSYNSPKKGETQIIYGCIDSEYRDTAKFRSEYLEHDEDKKTIVTQRYLPFGFVAGCHWGDDSAWKIQMLDLSEADKGIVKRSDPFGYVEMSDYVKLKDAIHIYDNTDLDDETGEIRNHLRIKIMHQQSDDFIDVTTTDDNRYDGFTFCGSKELTYYYGLESKPDVYAAFQAELKAVYEKFKPELDGSKVWIH